MRSPQRLFRPAAEIATLAHFQSRDRERVVDYQDLVTASKPERLRAALAANASDVRAAASQHHAGELASVRTESHRGREIVIKTIYEITVDGRPFDIEMTVDNGGRVHYHGLPTRDFPSAIDLVKKAIDFFPDDFDEADQPLNPDHAGNEGSHHADGHDQAGEDEGGG